MAEGHGAQLFDLGTQALERPGVGIMRVAASDGRGGEWMGEVVLLPLRSELGEMTRVMGAVNLDHPARGRRPTPPLRLRWVGSRLAPVEVDPFAAPAPPPLAEVAPQPAAAGFAEPAASFRRGPPAEKRPLLMAIEGNPKAPREDADSPRPRPRLRVVE